MDDDRLFRRWKHWLTVIHQDVQALLMNRHIYKEVRNVILANPKAQLESSFYDWMANVYATSIVIGIRRQVDRHADSVSFANLLKSMSERPAVLSRTRFVSLYSGSNAPPGLADRTFDKYACADGSMLEAEIPAADLIGLDAKAAVIRQYANKRVAHFDRSGIKTPPTYTDLDECLDLLEQLLRKYWLLLDACTMLHIVPVWQYDWKQVFRTPWIP